MTELVRVRVEEHLVRLRMGYVANRLDALLSEAARKESTFLDFLDELLREEVGSKQRKRVAMGMTIAHFPSAKTLETFDFRFQPSVDQELVRELATARFLTLAENVLILGPPGVGKTLLAIGLGRAAVEAGQTVLFISATPLIAHLSKAEAEGSLAEQLAFYGKPKLLIVDELGYLPFEKRSAHLFLQLVARRYERGSILLTTNQSVGQWRPVFGDDVLAAAILDRLLYHSHTLVIQNESYRLKQKRRAGLIGREPTEKGPARFDVPRAVEADAACGGVKIAARSSQLPQPLLLIPSGRETGARRVGQFCCRQGVNSCCRLTPARTQPL